MNPLPSSVVYACLAAFLGALAAVTVLSLAHVDALPVVAFLGAIPATVAGILNVTRTRRVESKVDGVATSVNGHLSRLSDAAGLPPATTTDQPGGPT